MKLTRITKIRQHRVFRNFAWPNDLHAFSQFNVIYGWNGCGKTTLSSLISLVEKRTALSEGELELEFDGTTKVGGVDLPSKPVPQVRVFNRDFINATLQSEGSAIAPIYFLGEDSVEKQKQVDKLKRDLTSANAAVMTAEGDKANAEAHLDEFCITQARIVKGVLTTANNAAYNNYDKRNFKRVVHLLNAQSAAAALLSDDRKSTLRKRKDAQPKPTIEEVNAWSFDLVAFGAEVEALVGRSVVAQTLDELTSNSGLASWVQHGLALHSGEHASERCRFCLQPFQAARRSALEAHFNDAFATFQHELAVLLSKLQTAKHNAASLRLPSTSSFYDHLVAEATNGIESVTRSAKDVESAIEALIARVETKRENLFKPPSTAPASSGTTGNLAVDIAALNMVVRRHNQTTEKFETSVDEACKGLESAYIAEAHAEYSRLVEAVTNADATLTEVRGKPASIQEKINTLERTILEHRRPADELTQELREYLGRDELRFELKGTGYALARGGQPVSHLSEGERTAITLLYFLKSLQDKTFDITRGIVVIDDPVSSLDANSLFLAFGYMKERTKQCGQLFILTHSFPLLRLVKNWFHHLPGQRKSRVDGRPARFFLLRSCRHSDGSRTSQLGPLDRMLEEYESEYQYLFKRVYEEAHRPDVDSLEYHYGLPNVARRLIEAFLAFRYPDLSGDLGPRLDRVAFDNSKKTRILRLLNTYSHSGAITEPEHDLSLLAETQPVLLDVLEMMKAVDRVHYEGLEKLVGRPAGREEGD